MSLVTGGVETGAALTAHAGIQAVHMTGSKRTHDAIVWGTGDEAARRKANNSPLLQKPMTSELGGVSPWIIVPGPWTEEQILHHAKQLVTAITSNNGYNCLAAKTLVLSKDWPLRTRFCTVLRTIMGSFLKYVPVIFGVESLGGLLNVV